MKKLIALMLVAALVFALTACSLSLKVGVPEEKPSLDVTDEPIPSEAIVGGWTFADSPVVTEEQKALLEKALEGLVGAEYTPVAYIASQLVAGTNHLMLCRVKPIVPAPNAIEKYALVYIYEDLQGNVTLDKVVDSGAWTYLSDEAQPGGWYETSPELSDELRAAFEQATENYIAAKLTPLAVVAEQVVAGKNYRYFCQVAPNAETVDYEHAIVNVYVDLDGNASFGLIEPFMENWQEVTTETDGAVPPFVNPIGDPIAPAQG